MAKKMKRIGWVIEVRETKRHKWKVESGGDYFSKKKDAIKMFDFFDFGDDAYKKQERAGLVRCVPVYVLVEVDDASSKN